MRLLRVEIEQFRSIEDQWIPGEGLVALFGVNSGGKTSVLEAVENVITQASAVRADPGADDEPFVMGSVWLELPPPERPDRTMRDCTGRSCEASTASLACSVARSIRGTG